MIVIALGCFVSKILEFAVGRDKTLRFGYVEPKRQTTLRMEESA